MTEEIKHAIRRCVTHYYDCHQCRLNYRCDRYMQLWQLVLAAGYGRNPADYERAE